MPGKKGSNGKSAMNSTTSTPLYQFKTGFRVKGITAQQLGERIELLRQRLGVGGGEAIPTPDIVADARHKTSPLYEAFDQQGLWDDSIAAEKAREEYARYLARSYTFTVRVSPTKTVPVRVNVRIRPGKGYESTSIAMQHAGKRTSIVKQAWEDLLSWKRKYEHLEEFAKICEVIEAQARKQHKGASPKIAELLTQV